MIKTFKLFSPGKWNGKKFTKEKMLEFAKNTKDGIKGIYAHTTKWLNEKTKELLDPLEFGEFSNIRVFGDDVVGDFEFNEKGEMYYNDKSITGISVEMDREKTHFKRVAFLPRGTKPAVKGNEIEFEEMEYVLEFEEINNNIEEGGEEMSLKDQISKLDKKEKVDLAKEILSGEGVEFELIKPEPTKTKEDYRLEFQAEEDAKKMVKEKEDLIAGEIKTLKEDMKLTPVQETEFEAILQSCDHSEKLDTLEFEEDGTTAIQKSQLERVIDFNKGTLKSYKSLLENVEFEKKTEKTDIEKYNDQIKGK